VLAIACKLADNQVVGVLTNNKEVEALTIWHSLSCCPRLYVSAVLVGLWGGGDLGGGGLLALHGVASAVGGVGRCSATTACTVAAAAQ
jgi:hypothetical protein